MSDAKPMTARQFVLRYYQHIDELRLNCKVLGPDMGMAPEEWFRENVSAMTADGPVGAVYDCGYVVSHASGVLNPCPVEDEPEPEFEPAGGPTQGSLSEYTGTMEETTRPAAHPPPWRPFVTVLKAAVVACLLFALWSGPYAVVDTVSAEEFFGPDPASAMSVGVRVDRRFLRIDLQWDRSLVGVALPWAGPFDGT